MSNNRDDFSSDTKKRLASRVSYMCSFPGCPAITIGPSEDSCDGVSNTGVAAHICAAAPGGKRYDSTMTPDQRKSIENGIWLCQTHSKLIDTDAETYTVEKLHQWKKDAEERARTAIADINYFSDYYSRFGENISFLQENIDSMLTDGNYDLLNHFLDNYKTPFTDKYNELIWRYRVIYDIHCNQAHIEIDLQKYIELPDRSGLNLLAEWLCEFLMKKELRIIYDLLDDELSDLVRTIIENDNLSELLRKINDKEYLEKHAKLRRTIYKTSSFILFCTEQFSVKDEKGKPVHLYDEGFLHECLLTTFELGRKTNNNFDPTREDVLFFLDNTSKINDLDVHFKELIYYNVLRRFVFKEDIFTELLNCIDKQTQKQTKLISLNFLFKIFNKQFVSIDELENFAKTTGDYFPLLTFLESLKPQELNLFIDEHQYLYKCDIGFLLLKHKIAPDELPKLIEKYKDYYSSDFTYNCLRVLYFNETDKIEWLKLNVQLIIPEGIRLYIDVLEKNNQFEELWEFANILRGDPFKFEIAIILYNNGFDYNKIEIILFSLINNHYEEKGVNHLTGLVQLRLGKQESALNYCKSEYDKYNSKQAILLLLEIRYNLNQFYEDNYLIEASKINDAKIQNIVGAFYLKLYRYPQAKRSFLKSLLLDNRIKESYVGLFNILVGHEKFEKPEEVSCNTVCRLVNLNESVTVAIHETDTLKGFAPSNLGLCKHFSQDNPEISGLMFSRKGDNVVFLDKNYSIESIISLDEFLIKLAVQSLMDNESVIKITGTIEETVEKMTAIMADVNSHNESVKEDYNQSPISFPLSSLSKCFGKNMHDTMLFLLYQNDCRIRNNTNWNSDILENKTTIFVASYDSIIILHCLEIKKHNLNKVNVILPTSVKNTLINDIDEELSHLQDKRNVGSLYYYNGGIAISEESKEAKQSRMRFLTELKQFVLSFEERKNGDFVPKNTDLNPIASMSELICENACLSLASSSEEYCLLSDEQFLYGVSSLEGILSIGMIQFLIILDLPFIDIIKRIKMLSHLNFQNYLTTQLYIKLEEKASKEDEQKELVNLLLSENDDKEPSTYHRQLIVNLYRELCLLNNSLIYYDTWIRRAAVTHISKLNPDFVNKVMDSIKREISREKFEEDK